jgi:hypothetical protein
MSFKGRKSHAIPLLSEPPPNIRAMLVCKVLVPKGAKDNYANPGHWNADAKNYSTKATGRVCPHLLVHISRLEDIDSS